MGRSLAQRCDRPGLVKDTALGYEALRPQCASEIAGHDISGDVQQPPALRAQLRRRETDEVGDGTPGARH